MPIDIREDAGEFYPGGKVISTRPVATGGDVKHSDFAGLDVKTNTIPDLRDAVRELGRRLGATVVTALAACVAIAATVQTVPVNDLDFDANPSIVTNVVFDAPPDFSTNNVALVETIEATAPAPGNYAAVSNKAMTAVQPGSLSFTNDYIRTSWADDNTSEFAGHANEANYADSAGTAEWATNANYADRAGDSDFSDYARKILFGANLSDAKTGEEMLALNKNYTDNATSNLARVAHTGSYNDLSNKPTIPTVPTNVSAFNNDAGYLTSYTETDPTVPQWAKAQTKPSYTAAEVGATSPAAVSNIVSTVYVREKLGVWMEYDEATGFYYYCHEEE